MLVNSNYFGQPCSDWLVEEQSWCERFYNAML